MEYGETWLAMQRQQSDNRKPRLKASKEQVKQTNMRIASLQNQRARLYDDDNLSDEEVKALSESISDKIEDLINSMYETKEEIKQRL